MEVNNVLHGHGKKARKLDAHGIGNAVLAANGDHKAVVVGFKFFRLRFFDICNNVMCSSFPGLYRSFHNLGQGFFVFNKPQIIAHGEYIAMYS